MDSERWDVLVEDKMDRIQSDLNILEITNNEEMVNNLEGGNAEKDLNGYIKEKKEYRFQYLFYEAKTKNVLIVLIND